MITQFELIRIFCEILENVSLTFGGYFEFIVFVK